MQLKRFLIFLLAVVIMLPFGSNSAVERLCLEGGTISYYIKGSANIDQAVVVKNGAGSIVMCSLNDYKKVKSQLIGNIDGVSFVADGTLADVEYICQKLRLKIVLVEQLEQITVIYGYTTQISGYLVADGKKVNVQIALRDGTLTVGSPLIFGSY